MKPICWKGKRFKACSFSQKYKKAGRNSSGRITIFHRGGGAKRLLRTIDFKRNRLSTGIVERIEYDPNRSARIALVRWVPNLSDNTSYEVELSQLQHTESTSFCSKANYGYFSYILACDRLKVGDQIMNSYTQSQFELNNKNTIDKGHKGGFCIENTPKLLQITNQLSKLSDTVQRLEKKGEFLDSKSSELVALNDKINNVLNIDEVLKDGENLTNYKTELFESRLASGPSITEQDKAIESLWSENKSPELKAKEWRIFLSKTAWRIASRGSLSLLAGPKAGGGQHVVTLVPRPTDQYTALELFVPRSCSKAVGEGTTRAARYEQLRVFSIDKHKPASESLRTNHLVPEILSEKMFKQVGNSIPLGFIPIGTFLHNIEERPGQGGKLVRSAGTFAQLVQKLENTQQSVVRLPSGILKLLDSKCRATIGIVSNSSHNTRKLTKAGQNRWLGKRPIVRGVAMNPIDHPHGGGEGRTKGGRPSVSPWGKPSKGGFKTVIRKKKTNYS